MTTEASTEQTRARLTIRADAVEVGDILDGVPVTIIGEHTTRVWVTLDDGRSGSFMESQKVEVERAS